MDRKSWSRTNPRRSVGFSKKSRKEYLLKYKGKKETEKKGGFENYMSTANFRTKTIFIKRKNCSAGNAWGIAVDIGYSGTKLFSPNCVACFPSFASPVEGAMLEVSAPGETNILYRDGETGIIWKVGKAAQDAVSTQDPDQNSTAIYGRQRYFNPMYLVIARTAMGIACTKNEYGDPNEKKICLQTGLPNSYLKSDTPLIREALTGTHIFDLKIGSKEWKHYEINLEKEDINVMAQPIGTLLSVSADNNGAATQDSMKYLRASVAICDPGFGTMDCFSLKGGEMKKVETSTEFTMLKVLAETSEKIFRKYNTEIPVPAMQKYLERGYITQFNRATKRGSNVDFNDVLDTCNKEIAGKTIDKLCELFDNLLDYDYLIVTGGTGEAWYPYFVDAFQGLPNLTLIPGNQNTEGMLTAVDGTAQPLPFIFSNARGYYMFLQRKLSQEKPIVA